MLNIVCLNSSDYLGMGKKYVEILYDSVKRNLNQGFAGKFVCFTDDKTSYLPGIEKRELPCWELNGWWNKLSLFRDDLFPEGDRIVYFDLDTLITGRLDEIVKYDGDFAILRDFYRAMTGGPGLQSSVMMWRAGNKELQEIWRQWLINGKPEPEGGDQQWIQEHCPDNVEILQDTFPKAFQSFKVSGGKVPERASVVVFHGSPRPHEVVKGWVPEVWKVGGLTRAELDAVCNTASDKLFANVRDACKRDLPWLDFVPAHEKHAVIVGGGPSLEWQIELLKFKQGDGQAFFALNGSARWLDNHGIGPDYHVIVDARPENVEFLRDGRQRAGTRLLLASQCDPSVFELGRMVGDITLWHSNAPGIEKVLADEVARPVHLIGGGSTVGLSAIVLAHVLGYRNIHLFGFDSSYIDDESHAFAQSLNKDDMTVDVVFGDRKFRCAPWMVQQAQEFSVLAAELIEDGTTSISVEGDGFLPHIAREMVRVPMMSQATARALEVLSRLDQNADIKGAEIGVFAGDMSKAMLRNSPKLSLIMVDSWEAEGAAYQEDSGSGDFHILLSQDAQESYARKAKAVTEFANGRRVIMPVRSTIAAVHVLDASLDFVFIDADHSYEGCKSDIETWVHKLKPGGLLSGHDYANTFYPEFGVTRAVDEFVAASGLQLDLGENFTWFVRLPSTGA